MGCASSNVATGQSASGPKVEIYALTASMNSMGAVLLVQDKKIGALVPTMIGQDGTQKPEYLAMNPYGQIPTMKDPKTGVVTAESSAILRYLATRYAPELYSSDPRRAGYIDWAMDNFSTRVYPDAVATIYPLQGFAAAPEDKAAAGKAASEHLAEYAKFFLREKFIGGSKPSIADYKVAPFFFSFAHPALQSESQVTCPDRIKQFVSDFLAECPSRDILNAAGGWSLKELLDKKLPEPAALLTAASPEKVEACDVLEGKVAKTGKTQLYAVPASMNCLGPLILGLDLKVAELVVTMPGQATTTEEFLAMNPFHAVPTMKDGDFALAESTAILRYYARTYKPELYSRDKQAHIDWAFDNFVLGGLYKDATATVYPALGFMPFGDNAKEVGAALKGKLQKYADTFLKGKFVGGDQLSIADYKIAPFFFSWAHPALKSKCGVEVPERIVQFNKDFAEASQNTAMFAEAGGYALKELLEKNA